jgi:hypothetical protein
VPDQRAKTFIVAGGPVAAMLLAAFFDYVPGIVPPAHTDHRQPYLLIRLGCWTPNSNSRSMSSLP